MDTLSCRFSRFFDDWISNYKRKVEILVRSLIFLRD